MMFTPHNITKHFVHAKMENKSNVLGLESEGSIVDRAEDLAWWWKNTSKFQPTQKWRE